MHVALVGAFPFPYPQGSQVFFAEQACGLQTAGARVTLICYGRGMGAPPADLTLVRAPLAPRKLTSGPSPGKPLADGALAAALWATHRRTPFDAVLAHNSEAALAALLVRPLLRCPVVYVAHTVLVHELETYAPPRFAPLLRGLGARIDRYVARRADAVIALASAGERELARHARGPVLRIPPCLAPAAAPAPAAQRASSVTPAPKVSRRTSSASITCSVRSGAGAAPAPCVATTTGAAISRAAAASVARS